MSIVVKSVMAVAMVATAAAAHFLTPKNYIAIDNPISLEQAIPLQFGDWKLQPGQAQVIESPERAATLNAIYSQVLDRVYVNGAGARMMLSVAYTENQGDNSGKQSHKPEICYPAQGFQILSQSRDVLKTDLGAIPVKHLLAVNSVRSEPLTYWSTIGSKVPSNEVEVKLAQLGYGFSGKIPDGVIFRVSSISSDAPSAYSSQQDFVNTLVKSLSAQARVRLTGIVAAS